MKLTRPLALAAAAAILLAVTGCSSDSGTSNDGLADQPIDGVSYAADHGETWPLTVDKVSVLCPGNNQLVIAAGGQSYAVNGLAKQTGEYDDIFDIWKDDPDNPGAKLDLTPVQELAESICG
ncbi:DUF2511 domain-containing protein [Luteimicrobium sp. NPDC057192]|uniref:DUF2511 domain-containing protein n=1 Tax=Luteimicrobium sp. NPDC057192 TaxID=3346042 RepID=UPI003635F251